MTPCLNNFLVVYVSNCSIAQSISNVCYSIYNFAENLTFANVSARCGLGQRKLIYGKFNSYTQTSITIIDYFQITEKEVLLIRYIIIVLML